jgi:phage-related protein
VTESIPASFYVAKNARRSIYPYNWLFRIDRDGSSAFYLAGSEVAIVYGGNTYSPFPIGVTGLDVDGESTLPTPQVIVSNVTREVAVELETGNVIDRTCQIYLYSAQAGTAIDKGSWRIVRVVANLQAATFSLAQYGLLDVQVPSIRQERGRCPYVYGGDECLYQTSLPNLIAATSPNFDPTTCDLTLNGANGCRVHGTNEVANGKPRLHPDRFGGFPGIPKGPARV